MAETSSSSAATPSDADRQEMLDRMLTSLALADDHKLQALLTRILPYSISSLSSSSPSIRKLVMEILSHVNKRVKHHPEIGLPLAQLWSMYREFSGAPMVRNFCVVYIEMAFDRLPVVDKANMAPELLADISKFPSQHQDIILRIVSKVIGECHSTSLDENIGAKYKDIGSGRDGQIFVEFCLHTLLYQPLSHGARCPPGLSVSQSERVTGKLPLKGDLLVSRKVGILNVIEAMDLAPEIVYPLYLAGSADSHELVIKRSEELSKKKAAGANIDDSNLIKRLFFLFNGNTGVENVPEDSRVSPVNVALRVRIMSVFCRSIVAANSFPSTLQCIFGCIYGSGTTSRLKQLGMEFTVWVFKHSVMDQLRLMGPVVLSGILRSLDGSSVTEADATAGDAKSFAFQAIGLLASRLPHLFREKIDMAVRLFNALKLEDQSIRLTIQESVTSLAIAYKGAPAVVLKDLESLLLENCQAEQSEVRFCSVRWATSLFDLEHCPSRYICMVGAADPKLDIREMALGGLHLLKDQDQMPGGKSDVKFPDFGEMLDYISMRQPQILEPTKLREEKLLFPSKTYIAMIRFLMNCFAHDHTIVDFEGGINESGSPVVTMCLLLEHALALEGSAELQSISSKALVEIGSRLPQFVAARYAERISWLKLLLSHIDSDTRVSASRLLGIASSAISISQVSSLLNELASSIIGTKMLRFENYHGTLCAIGYMTAESMRKAPSISEAQRDQIVEHLVKVVESESAILASTAMEALGHIGLRCALPALPRDSNSVGVVSILNESLRKLLSGNDIKAIQKILVSLGHICVKETSYTNLNIALDLVFILCRSKVEDLLFAAGEAISFIWGGVPVTADLMLKSNYSSLSDSSNYLSGEMALSILKSGSLESNINEESRVMAREVIVKKLFEDLLYSSRKDERCAGTVWLLSLTMYCGYDPKIQQLLPEVQEAFSHLLGDQNDLTQELASKGMSIVYELGDPSMKHELVNALVGTLTGSGKRKRAIKLMGDSEVFQEGSIGETLGGGKLSTYKELCSLANEMGQPDLIYKFMDLANYQASLNSKRGAAFGFSKIAKHAGDALQPHLQLLIPRLVRYQYDPDKNVQDAMGHIWKSIIADTKKTIDAHFDIIIDDLLMQSGSRLWRSREASCLALADIIQGRKFDQVSKYLKKIWTAAFRAMDDVKETVRNSGDSLCRAVSSLTIRLCDVSLTAPSDASQAMDIVLPYLLVEGIVSKVSSIQKASVGLVMKLAKGAGIALRPHLPELVCCMLECLSSLEDQSFNYVELHAENAGIRAEKLDNLRIAIAKDSTMWETLDLCLKVVDKESLDLLVPRLTQLVRSGVGLNTRVGVASFITLLVQKVTTDIKPFTSTLLKLLFAAVLEEKSKAAKRSFAAACAMVLKYAGPSQAQKLIEDTAALHLGERTAQISCAILLRNYSNFATDIVSGYHAVIVPVTFVSRFEDDKDISALFEELWEENTSSERMTLQLYLSEIVSLLSDCMSSSSWASKRKSAKAITKLSEIMGESLSSMHQNLLNSLLKELTGRYWEGKDTILYAVASLCSSCHDVISNEDAATPNAILGLISSACTKKVKSYREAAFSSLKQVITAFKNPEFFNNVFPLLYEICDQAGVPMLRNTPLMTTAEEKGGDSTEDFSASLDKVLDCMTSSIQIAYPEDILKHQKNLLHVLSSVLSHGFSWTVKMSAFSTIKALCSKLSPVSEDKNEFSHDAISFIQEMFHSLASKVVECIHTIKISQVHIAASECLLEVSKLYSKSPALDKGHEIKSELIHLLEVEKSEEAKSLLRNCIQILEDLEQQI
ncbi:proteasome component ECM29 protein [Dioscorea alata]|uniref:Proteasome component ECM29 protein n=1 Tax=Dioscorea alata TaxID=55571 RepID=A0ACB7VE18_DIOAL|nr:proteasome component ECM29 protein [Dioscorea alata]